MKSYLYPNAVTTTYNYNSLNRLSSMNSATGASTFSSYTYTLGAAGNRTAVTELSGRTVNYTYDDLYRLTNETVANDTHGINGTVGYGYDSVGNRLSRTSSVAGVPSQSSTYDANDRLTADTYDANGNTKTSSGGSYDYDFENRLITHTSSVTSGFVYDGDGNRVGKTVDGITTNYLVDTNNHTGYAQVIEELQGGVVVKQFTYGHDLISQRCSPLTANCSLSFYGYDGHGSVRLLTDATASVTDAYDYDAFGNLIYRLGTTPNDYLHSGEQLDATLGFYYLRARYMDPTSGRFWTMDSFEGNSYDPLSLHKYLYAHADPVDHIDPSGRSIVDQLVTFAVHNVLTTLAISAPLRALQVAIDVSNGASLGTAVQDAALGLVTDAAIGLALGGVLSQAPRLVRLRSVGQSITSFIEGRAANSVWRLAPFPRGRAIEQTILGRPTSLGTIPNFPVIDDFANGVATSIKSVDVTAASYQSTSALTSRLTTYAQELSEFQGATRVGVRVAESDISKRVLLVALEDGAMTAQQAQALRTFQQSAAQQWPNIKVVLQFIP